MQAAHLAKPNAECNESSVVLQLDFSENASLLQQNEIQSAHWIHEQVTVFTAHASIGEGVNDSFFIISDSLNHTKEAVYTFIPVLFRKLLEKYPLIEAIMFSVMERHPSSNSDIYFQIFMAGKRSFQCV